VAGSACLYNYLELLLEWTWLELSKVIFLLCLSASFVVFNNMRCYTLSMHCLYARYLNSVFFGLACVAAHFFALLDRQFCVTRRQRSLFVPYGVYSEVDLRACLSAIWILDTADYIVNLSC
jgi:hypothetical protein